jgi:hypothetical protein
MLQGEAGNDRPLIPPWGPTLSRSCTEFGEDGIPGWDRNRINAPHTIADVPTTKADHRFKDHQRPCSWPDRTGPGVFRKALGELVQTHQIGRPHFPMCREVSWCCLTLRSYEEQMRNKASTKSL